MKYLLIILILFTSCNPFISKELRRKNKCNRKLDKVTRKCPELTAKDTLITNFDTTIVTKVVRVDTVINSNFDTVEIIRDKFSVKLIQLNDTILVNGGCESDTIYIDKIIKVPYSKVQPIKLTFLQQLANLFTRFWWWLLIGFVAYVVYKKLF
jgi:hypothetical protein